MREDTLNTFFSWALKGSDDVMIFPDAEKLRLHIQVALILFLWLTSFEVIVQKLIKTTYS